MNTRKALITIIFLLLIVTLALPVSATTTTIDNTSATALATAVQNAGTGDTIILGAGTYFEHDITISGKSLTIQANTGSNHGPSDTIIDAQSSGRIFNVTDASPLTIDNLTLRNGKAANGAAGADSGTGEGDAGSAGGSGGAILSVGPVAITTSVITGCSAGKGGNGGAGVGSNNGGNAGAGGNGGAISATGTVTVIGTTITGCSAGTGGAGGIGSSGGRGGTGGSGGAISATGAVTITGSTLTGCSAGTGSSGGNGWGSNGGRGTGGNGGAISAADTVTVSTSTITGCSAGSGGTSGAGIGSGGNGGAIFTTGTVTVTTSTITGCSAGSPNPDDPDHRNQGLGVAVYSNGGYIHFCRLVNVIPSNNVEVYGSGSIDATDNWWGTNSTPSAKVSSSVTYNPWLVLGITASPASIDMATTSVIRANLTYRSTGTDRSSSGTVPDGIPVSFSSAGGTFAPGAGNITSGANATRFTPSVSGSARISAVVDSETVSFSLPVLPAARFTATPISGNAPLTVQFTDTSQGSPASWSWYFGSYSTADSGVSTSQNPSHTYDTAGTYSVTLRVNSTPGDYVYYTRTGYIVVTTVPVTTSPTTIPVTTVTTTSSGSSGGSSMSGSSGSDSSGDGGGSLSSATTGTASANVGGNSAVNTVTVTGTGVSGVIITGTQRDTLPSGVPQAAPGTYQYVELTPARADSITGATISFEVPVSWLEGQSLTTTDIAMTRYHDGAWVTLPTTFNGVTNGIASYSARSPGFSLFAIVPAKGAAQESGTASLSCPNVRAPATCPVCPGISAGSQVLSSGAVAATETSAVPAPSMPGTNFPLATIALIGAGCIVLIGSGWYVRRWWIRRQNPGLFREYD